jgi:hypothetical protein
LGGNFQENDGFQVKKLGKGKVILSPIIPEDLQGLDIKRDVEVVESSGNMRQILLGHIAKRLIKKSISLPISTIQQER